MARPNYAWAMFGRGQFGQIRDILIDGVDEVGREMKKVFVYPSKSLIDFYRLEEADFNRDGTVTRRYPSHQIVSIPDDLTRPAYLFLCGFNGEENTPVMRVFVELKLALESYEKTIRTQRNEIAYLRELVEQYTGQHEEFEQRQIDRMKRIMSIKGTHQDSNNQQNEGDE